MTSKDYNALADVICVAHDASEDLERLGERGLTRQCEQIAQRIADVCAADNPRFDRDRFLIACGVPR